MTAFYRFYPMISSEILLLNSHNGGSFWRPWMIVRHCLFLILRGTDSAMPAFVLRWGSFDEVVWVAKLIFDQLKFLYVAITWARENVWIVDSSEKGQPMRVIYQLRSSFINLRLLQIMYWTERDLVRDIKPGTNAPRLATTEEWAVQGRHLFDRKNGLKQNTASNVLSSPTKWQSLKLIFLEIKQRGQV